jgi:hypothetical protein
MMTETSNDFVYKTAVAHFSHIEENVPNNSRLRTFCLPFSLFYVMLLRLCVTDYIVKSEIVESPKTTQ